MLTIYKDVQMRKLVISIFVLCSCFVSYGYSEAYLSDFFEVIHDEALQKEAFSIDKKIQDKYQAVAKQFSKKGSSKGSTETNLVTYDTLSSGVHVHIGWYVDGSIVTALDGTEAGKQLIFINGSVVGISYDIKTYNGYFTHNYTWAKVTSYTNKQILKTK